MFVRILFIMVKKSEMTRTVITRGNDTPQHVRGSTGRKESAAIKVREPDELISEFGSAIYCCVALGKFLPLCASFSLFV